MNNRVLTALSYNLIYQLFSLLTGQGKKSDAETNNCFDNFCESLPDKLNLDEYKGQGYQILVSFVAKQYETLVRNNVSSTIKS
jgi:hypothetical protein